VKGMAVLDFNEKRQILLIAYHFPPDSAVGAIRPAKFAKYLSELGWEPTILSVKTCYYDQLDGNDHENPQSLIIKRTTKLPTLKETYLSLKKVYLRSLKNISLAKEQQKWMSSTPPLLGGSMYIRLHRYFNSLFIYLPDNQIGWFVPAMIRGLLLFRRNSFDAILTTGPPHSIHLIGLALRMMTKAPWVVDFRDPWSIKSKGPMTRSKLSDFIEEKMMQQVIRHSDVVINVTPEMTAELFKRSGAALESKFVNLSNGFDLEELKPFLAEKKYPQLTITYAGSFYMGRNPFLLLKAVADLIREGRLRSDQIQINLIGNCQYADGISVEAFTRALGLTRVVKIVEHLPHKDVLGIMARSHGLLLLAPGQPLQIPAKTYEYIGLGAFIIAVCEKGATQNLLKDYPFSIIVDPLNLEAMKGALVALSRQKDCDGSPEARVFSERYQHRYLTGCLVDVLESITQAVENGIK